MHKLQSRSLQPYEFTVKYYLLSQILLEGPKCDPSCPLQMVGVALLFPNSPLFQKFNKDIHEFKNYLFNSMWH